MEGTSRLRLPAQLMRGTMLWFNEDKDHGYISTEQGERLYVDGSGFDGAPPRGPCAGVVVEFELIETGELRQARNARVVPVVAPRRARRRHSR